jgi:hypothetical protein
MRQARVGDTSVFVVDWDKRGERTSWRTFFVVDELVRVCFTSNYSKFWMLLWAVFLLQGVNVDSWAKSDTRTALGQGSPSPMLLFFLGCCCVLTPGFVLKLIRKLLSTWWPYRY